MWCYILFFVFMIVCFDECDFGKYCLFGLIYLLWEFIEMRYCFVIISFFEEGLMSCLVGNYIINLEDFDIIVEVVWIDMFEKIYEFQLGFLVDE